MKDIRNNLELGNRELADDYYSRALFREEMNAEDLYYEREARFLFYAYVAVAVVSLLVLLPVVFVVA